MSDSEQLGSSVQQVIPHRGNSIQYSWSPGANAVKLYLSGSVFLVRFRTDSVGRFRVCRLLLVVQHLKGTAWTLMTRIMRRAGRNHILLSLPPVLTKHSGCFCAMGCSGSKVTVATYNLYWWCVSNETCLHRS